MTWMLVAIAELELIMVRVDQASFATSVLLAD